MLLRKQSLPPALLTRFEGLREKQVGELSTEGKPQELPGRDASMPKNRLRRQNLSNRRKGARVERGESKEPTRVTESLPSQLYLRQSQNAYTIPNWTLLHRSAPPQSSWTQPHPVCH